MEKCGQPNLNDCNQYIWSIQKSNLCNQNVKQIEPNSKYQPYYKERKTKISIVWDCIKKATKTTKTILLLVFKITLNCYCFHESFGIGHYSLKSREGVFASQKLVLQNGTLFLMRLKLVSVWLCRIFNGYVFVCVCVSGSSTRTTLNPILRIQFSTENVCFLRCHLSFYSAYLLLQQCHHQQWHTTMISRKIRSNALHI